jgi:hypothetical protein
VDFSSNECVDVGGHYPGKDSTSASCNRLRAIAHQGESGRAHNADGGANSDAALQRIVWRLPLVVGGND